MKRGFIFLIFLFGYFFVGFTDASSNLLLDNSTWDVTESWYTSSAGNGGQWIGPTIFLYGGSNSAVSSHDGNYNTIFGYFVNWGQLDVGISYSFPNPTSISAINYSYNNLGLGGYSSDCCQNAASCAARRALWMHPNPKVSLLSGGVWTDISTSCAIINSRSNCYPLDCDPQVPQFYSTAFYINESCIGSWNNVQKINISFSGFACESADGGGMGGRIALREIQAFGSSSVACTPTCVGKECGDNGCGGTCLPGCSAGETCSDGNCLAQTEDDIIMKLSSFTDAHGALWNDTSFLTTNTIPTETVLPVYRFYNGNNGDHFYTINETEKSKVIQQYPTIYNEGIAFYAYANQVTGTLPVYRFWSATGDHFYTINETEKNQILNNPNYVFEQIAFYAYANQVAGTLPVYKFWNGITLNQLVGNNFYTIKESERNKLLTNLSFAAWTPKGIAFYTFPSETQYYYNIRYSDIFGSPYTGTNPHQCNSNKIVGLSNYTNAHSQIPSLNTYSTDVCYGNLQCIKDQIAGESCSNGGKVVLRLSGDTDAHLSDSSSAYPIKICCTPTSGGTTIGNAFWQDTDSNLISNADLGDTVKLVYKNSSLALGQVISFEIYERDDGLLSRLLDYDDEIRKISLGNQINATVNTVGEAIAQWKISEADMQKTNDFENFTFKVDGIWSNQLNISNQRNDTKMILRILSPKCADYFNSSDLVHIKIEASDDDDVINGKVRILLGNVEIENLTITNGITEINKNLITAGNYQIILEGVNTRGKAARKISNIMVINPLVNDRYVAACIDSPEDFTYIPSGVVEFDARSTRGIDYVASSHDYKNISKEDINFSWEFSDGRTNPNTDGINPLSYYFNKTFNTAGNNSAFLSVEIKSSYAGD